MQSENIKWLKIIKLQENSIKTSVLNSEFFVIQLMKCK
jgi:hypothetical protein